MIEVLLPLFAGFAVAVALTPVSMWIARRNGVVAVPAKDRWSIRVTRTDDSTCARTASAARP